MSTENDIKKFLGDHRADFISSYYLSDFSGILFLEVNSQLVKEKSGGGFTSKRQLTFLSRHLKERFGLNVLIIYRSSQMHMDLKTGLRALLLRNFDDFIVNVYVSFSTDDKAFVWVELNQILEKKLADNVQGQVSRFLNEAGIKCIGIEFLYTSQAEPSLVEILHSVKVEAPADIKRISNNLKESGLVCPSDQWLLQKLDLARKKDLVIRNLSGTYALTANGLMVVPHTRSRTSSDIRRMLLFVKKQK